MRVADLDRDHSAVFPEGLDRTSEFFYERTAERTYAALGLVSGGHVLDAAAGVGTDGRALAERGHVVTQVEPSKVLTTLSGMLAEREGWSDPGERVRRVRAFGEAMPFEAGAFDASFCKGSLDHFDHPLGGIAELARVTRRDGRVVLAVANMESAGLRWLRLRARAPRMAVWRRARPATRVARGRQTYHVPPDHFTRYDPALLLAHARPHLRVDRVEGVSLFWGVPGYTRLIERLPAGLARALLRLADRLARRLPGLSDLIVISGCPR